MIRSRSKSSGEDTIIRSVGGFDSSYIGEISPFTHNNSIKTRWLMTSSIAGVFGALVIGSAFFLTYESSQVAVSNVNQDTLLSSRIPLRIAIDNKSDQTEMFIGDVPVIGGKSVVDRLKTGKTYTNVVVTFGQSEMNFNRLAKRSAAGKRNGLSIKPHTGDDPGQKVDLSKVFDPVVIDPNSSVLGTINLGEKISNIMGFQTSKPAILDDSISDHSVSGVSPRDAASNITHVSKREPHNKTVKIPFQTVSISAGDTLVEILTDHGAFLEDAKKIVAALKPHYQLSTLKEGQKVTFALAPAVRDGKQVLVPNVLELATGPDKRLIIERNEFDHYALLRHVPSTEDADQFHASAKIKKSLYLAARNQGIPDNIIVDMMRIHAYDVDFQREVRMGDSFEVFYGDEKTLKKSKKGTVMFSSLTLSGNAKSYYRFKTTDDNIIDYYDSRGRSAKKFLMRTPIDGARLSSGFGMRRHPILRYTRMHRGVDFAAPRGTPIKAAGNGVVEKKGGAGGYGKYIRIRHANKYKTAYGHMSRYAKGIKPGTRVRQGQIIGYVGSTGRSTGNHLHYEVWLNGKAVNPMRIKVPTGRQLTGKMLAKFNTLKLEIDTLRKTAPNTTRVAAAREAQRDEIN